MKIGDSHKDLIRRGLRIGPNWCPVIGETWEQFENRVIRAERALAKFRGEAPA